MSLRDQLQKLGFLSKEKMKRAERAVAKSQHKQDVTRRARKADEHLLVAELAEAEERRRDQLALESEQAKREDELIEAQMLDIIRRGELKDPTAKDTYCFTLDDGHIENITVNEFQSLQLAAGELAVAFFQTESRYVIISRKNAEKILRYRPQLIVCFHKRR